ncbi:MAG: amidohydrolase [Deltaproteobacteria bacterium]|nr:amidohydrolase [Deltaproteobacteria bacterium]
MHLVDILVKNATLVTMAPDMPVIEPGAVAVAQDRIAAAGPQQAVLLEYKAAKVIDAKGGIVMPGLVNTHTHAAMSLFRGLADDLPLMTWLEEHIFPAEAELTQDMVYRSTLLACAEMIKSGTTTFCDMYLFEDAVAQAAKQAGLRAVVGEVIYDFASPSYGPVEKGLEYTSALIDKWRRDPLITIAVEPHSPYLCSPDLLQKLKAIADENQAPMVIHLSESQHEVAQIQDKFGKTPPEHLADLGILGPRLIADHCVALTENDITLLKQYDVKVAHNPESNMKLASGIAPIPALLSRGVTVGVGTDGCASNNNLDLFQEMDTLAKLHKVQTLDPTVLDARTVVKMATLDGACVLGLDACIGSLEPGKKADLIIVDVDQPHLVPMYNVYSHLVYTVSGHDVVTAIVNGRILMQDRQLLSLHEEAVMRDVNKIAIKIIKKETE